MDRLTARETAIAVLVAQAKSNKVIARELGVTEGTVKMHLHNIFCKLGINSRVMLALSMGARDVIQQAR